MAMSEGPGTLRRSTRLSTTKGVSDFAAATTLALGKTSTLKPYAEGNTPNATSRKPVYHRLCRKCRHMVETSESIASSMQMGYVDEKIGETWKHYKTTQVLAHSAMKGCHLCSLLHRSIRDATESTYSCIITHINYGQGLQLRGNIKVNFGSPQMDRVEIYNIGPADPQDHMFSGTLQSFGTDSDETFSLARSWLNTCLGTHHGCKANAQNKTFRPRRLLKVGVSSGRLSIKLCTTEEASTSVELQYLTLSYCWGEGNHLKLTQATEEVFYERIPLEDLPRTLLDAAIITRRLGYTYLWIDALCILQDCPIDMEGELKSMGEVYKNSVCTIAALSAENAQQGCFVRRNPLALDYCQATEKSSGLWFGPGYHSTGPDTTHPHRAILNTRAWVVQERAISPRTLYYGSEMIFWECIQARASELRPSMKGMEALMANGTGLKSVFRYLLDICRTQNYDVWIDYWRRLVEDYTACQITYDTDKWRAFSALATEVEQQSGKRLLHGLWEHQLLEELLWRTNRPGRRLRGQGTQFPSWSWTSIQAIVEWPKRYFARELEWTVTISSPFTRQGFPFAISSIVVEAPLLILSDTFACTKDGSGVTSMQLDSGKGKAPTVSKFLWDPDTDESMENTSVYTLQLLRYHMRTCDIAYYQGLIVTPIDNSCATWRRLGYYFATWDLVCFKESKEPPLEFGERKEITLI